MCLVEVFLPCDHKHPRVQACVVNNDRFGLAISHEDYAPCTRAGKTCTLVQHCFHCNNVRYVPWTAPAGETKECRDCAEKRTTCPTKIRESRARKAEIVAGDDVEAREIYWYDTWAKWLDQMSREGGQSGLKDGGKSFSSIQSLLALPRATAWLLVLEY